MISEQKWITPQSVIMWCIESLKTPTSQEIVNWCDENYLIPRTTVIDNLLILRSNHLLKWKIIRKGKTGRPYIRYWSILEEEDPILE